MDLMSLPNMILSRSWVQAFLVELAAAATAGLGAVASDLFEATNRARQLDCRCRCRCRRWRWRRSMMRLLVHVYVDARATA